jgi:hypothetical protein
MKHLKLFEAYIKNPVKTIDIDGYKINITDCTDVPGHKAIYTVEERSANGTGAYPVCFSDIELAKNYINGMIERNEVNTDEVQSFLIRKMMLDLVDVESEEEGETPPKWVKNPKSWAMDKIVSLLTPENINQIANCYISSGIFDFKELNNLKSNMKAIYQSSKDKKELDVTDHIRRFSIKSIKGVHYLKGDKNKIAKKFGNLLRYFQEEK